jgi:hypothetical protein
MDLYTLNPFWVSDTRVLCTTKVFHTLNQQRLKIITCDVAYLVQIVPFDHLIQ